MISCLAESRFPIKRNSDFHAPDRRWISPRIIQINKLMPPVSRFGGSGRAKKKQGVIEKLKAFFEKYFGLGITEMQSEKEEN